jgi:hypothetical protein
MTRAKSSREKYNAAFAIGAAAVIAFPPGPLDPFMLSRRAGAALGFALFVARKPTVPIVTLFG